MRAVLLLILILVAYGIAGTLDLRDGVTVGPVARLAMVMP